MNKYAPDDRFVHWFRQSSPYIHAFRGRTFVIAFDGAAVATDNFDSLIHDVALLNSLGIRLVLVHGARPQIEQRLNEAEASIDYAEGLRITNDAALACVKEAAGRVRFEIEALLSMGVANSPMAGARIKVSSGNFVTAKPLGVRNGIDYLHTGEVRRVDTAAIQQQLDNNSIVLLSPIGYSPTGEVFNLTANEVASATAIALNADKLIFLTEGDGLWDRSASQRIRELTLGEAQSLVQKQGDDEWQYTSHTIRACMQGVPRCHLIGRHIDGGLLLELFSRDGVGTLVSAESYEGTRQATIEDVGGILELIKPLETQGILVKRSREQLELEIDHFTVIERDNTIIACGALYPFANDNIAELACLAIHPDYQGGGRGEALLAQLERNAQTTGIQRLFVLTTLTLQWFQEMGYAPAKIEDLPVEKQTMYNYQRKSKVFIKAL